MTVCHTAWIRAYKYNLERVFIMNSIKIFSDEQALNWLTAICYMQGKYKYFMTDEDYKKFSDHISTERKNCNNRIYCFERAMQNVHSMFMELCYAERKSWAVMLAEIAQEIDIDDLLRICNMRVKFDKPKNKY